MRGTPFIVVDWGRPFLPALLDIVLGHSTDRPYNGVGNGVGSNLGDTLIVFPHGRPARYMETLLREKPGLPKPLIVPQMLPVTALFSRIRSHYEQQAARGIGLLDQVALLLGCVRRTRELRGGLLARLPLDDPRRFFPWGVRLAKLMDDFFIHNRIPGDYAHMEGELTPFAAALLENLSAIHEGYMAALDAGGWTTPGYDAFKAAGHAAAHDAAQPGEAMGPFAGQRIFLAGFHTLTGTQQLLFHHLWRHGATLCLHADPAIAPDAGKSPHWSCAEFCRWASSWHTQIRPHRSDGDSLEPQTAPRIRYRAGYDVHSQLAELSETLTALRTEQGDLKNTAIVLPDTSLLLPVLHHLPDEEVNISMGYPLGRSPLFRLLESVLRLQETRSGDPEAPYHWKAAISILRHPYCKMLSPLAKGAEAEEETAPAPAAQGQASAAGERASFRRLLHYAETALRQGRRYASLKALCSGVIQGLPEAEQPDSATVRLMEKLLHATVFNWNTLRTPADLARALSGLVQLLLEHGSGLWSRFPIDAECLFRLMQSVIPQLAHSALTDEAFDARTLFAMLRHLLAQERTPFEADPLVGLQVMGMLETRLLHFRQVYILDVTDDLLPGAAGHDPLLPDALRGVLGLPDLRGRDTIVAYTFFRLLAGADQVTLFWQEGVEPQGLADGKKLRSRFVEELLWQEEKQQGRLLAPEKNNGMDGPLRSISCALPPLVTHARSIPATQHTRLRLRTLLSSPLSPSMLDSYLRCPAQFFHTRLGRLQNVDSVNERDDPQGLGTLLHQVLFDYLAPLTGTAIQAGWPEQQAMKQLFLKALADSPLAHSLPADSRIMVEEAGPELLARMLKAQEGSTPLRLEERLTAYIDVDGRQRTLAGILDRVDERDGCHIILDYKTGSPPRCQASLWSDDSFLAQLAAWRGPETTLSHNECLRQADQADPANPPSSPGAEDEPCWQTVGDALLHSLAERVGSIQLACYMYLYSHGLGLDAHDAAYVELYDASAELRLLGSKLSDEERAAACEQIPLLLRFIVRHMEHSARFFPRKGVHCDWCSCKTACMVLFKGESNTLISDCSGGS